MLYKAVQKSSLENQLEGGRLDLAIALHVYGIEVMSLSNGLCHLGRIKAGTFGGILRFLQMSTAVNRP